jgi:hypothetical protein
MGAKPSIRWQRRTGYACKISQLMEMFETLSSYLRAQK